MKTPVNTNVSEECSLRNKNYTVLCLNNLCLLLVDLFI